MAERRRKYIFVVGGVMSGVGKGIASSSIGTILKGRGLRVTALKIDPYINVDAGTMNPTEHGETFVLKDGLETDQDMGNYERFLNETLGGENYMTTGSVYRDIIKKERNLEYGGRNVQVVPDVPLYVIERIKHAAQLHDADVTIIEIGGTVGEYENILFLEAARLLKLEAPSDVAMILVSYLPVPGSVGEMKTKPTQHAARALNSAGVFADFIIARAPVAIDEKRKAKISLFCNVPKHRVISAPDVASIYDVPLNFEADHLSDELCAMLGLTPPASDLSAWRSFVEKARSPKGEVRIAIAGKYFNSGEFVLSDVYISVIEALKFSAYHLGVRPVITYLNTRDFDSPSADLSPLSTFDAILVPGGFGETGIEGKIRVIQYAREQKVPYLGLCYGMQLMVVEYARHVLGLADANTTEIAPETKHPVIDILPEQKAKLANKEYGGSMRLGTYTARITPGTLAHGAYQTDQVDERHRHRYEVNPEYVGALTQGGMVFSGTSPNGVLMEIAELPKSVHPFMLATQFHPELVARPLDPHPLFTAFIQAALTKNAPKP
jgi:CTP synthase